MKRAVLSLAVVLATLLTNALPALAAVDTAAAVSYLQTQQNADGGFGSGFTPDSTLSSTADVVLALVAAGTDPASLDQGGNTPLTYLSAQADAAVTAGDLSKLILATVAAGRNPRDFGGVDAVARLEALAGADGRIGGAADTFVSHALAILALASTQRPIAASALDYLLAAQQESGAWAWDGTAETVGDTNTTAFAVQALVAAGEPGGEGAIAAALDYYRGIQNDDGGWPYQNPSQFGTDSDANSTAVVIQALVAAAEDPAGADWTTPAGNTPVAALEAFQNESGAFAWQMAMPDDNLLATVQALPAVAGKAFPLATMEVGELVATLLPSALPETGGAGMNLVLPLLLGGAALAAGGLTLRRRPG